jgi:hypothetical protein
VDKKRNQASLTISLQKCIIDLPKEASDKIKGLVQFEKFIMGIGFLLYRIYTNRTQTKNKNKKITKLLNLFKGESRIVEESILSIATFAHRGAIFGSLTDKSSEVRVTNEKKSKFGIGSKADLSFLSGAEQFSAYANAEIQKNIHKVTEENYNETAYMDFNGLRRDFVEFLDALNISRLYILIDEWSALDRRSTPSCQVYFAEYLKRAFFGTSRISLKFSAIQHESKFEDIVEDEPIGLEVDADIFPQVNLVH